MPGNTTRGYPYPVGTDRVMDGDDAIKALAETVDPRLGRGIASGTATMTITAVNQSVSVAVTFPVGLFPTAPYVASGAQSNNPNNGVVSIASVTNTGFIMWGSRSASTSNLTGHWIAHSLA